ncbi:MAG: ABC transporter substrate-binding protein [Cytophagales bacterium]|nr:MAG: ABC transporter substrate-binding protein [Cytophagales bacterium]TAF61481.1 MAG: ABC transporter substrate-binding protein [Cytophagales bacterium]
MFRNLSHLILIAFVALAFSACSGEKQGGEGETAEAKGGKFYGGVLHINESEYIRTLYPPSILDVYSYRVAAQIYEGLFKFDPKTLKVINGLAESVTIDDAKTTYTIKLRKGVMFHDDACFEGGKGRELKAKDILYCMERLCTKTADNQNFELFDGILKGAKNYYESSGEGKKPPFEFEGVKVVDDYTIKFVLEKPYSLFTCHLARPAAFIYPEEAVKKYGKDLSTKAIGTGPFSLGKVEEETNIMLMKNKNYYLSDKDGNKLPFLDAVSVRFIKEKKTELLEFNKGNLDMMYRLPTEHLVEIMEKSTDGSLKDAELSRAPEMQTQLLVFNTQVAPFDNADVRRAFSFAINRANILDNTLLGEGFAPGEYGITSPSFKDIGYDVAANVRGYTLNKDSALYYLNKAGYKNGKGFPQIYIELNAEGDRHASVALEVKKQLKEVLNVDAELSIMSHSQVTDRSTSGSFKFIRLSWIADYPHPQSFVRFFYGKGVPAKSDEVSFPNLARYKNPKFDDVYEAALNTVNEEEALKLFMQAEYLAMRDAPVLVLWYDEAFRLLKNKVKNFPNNAIQYRDLTEVYIQPDAAK